MRHGDGFGVTSSPVDPPADGSVAAALVRTHEWFEVNSGWAPPDEETLVDWGLEGMGRAPDECLVTEHGVCAHGLASWRIVLDDLAHHDRHHPGRPSTEPGDGRRPTG